MIASIRGQVASVDSDSLIIEIGGIGLQVYVPIPLLEHAKTGQSVYLHTHFVVRQDALTLFGFNTIEERAYFIVLLGVNGVGPRLALSILSALTPESIRVAVAAENAEMFSSVSGVGKKTAQKIVLHLQDRIPGVEGLAPISVFSDADSEVMAALTALGYSVVESQSAVQSIPIDAPEDIENRLRLALRYFSS